MGIQKGEAFRDRDVFVDFPFEEVMFRWDHVTKLIFRRFYGEAEQTNPVPHDNNLFNEALRFGEETTRERYMAGQVSRSRNEA